MTKCSAIITLKLDNGDFTSQDVKNAQENRLQTIEDQIGICKQMSRINIGTNEEIKSKKKEERLHKEKEKVSLELKCLP